MLVFLCYLENAAFKYNRVLCLKIFWIFYPISYDSSVQNTTEEILCSFAHNLAVELSFDSFHFTIWCHTFVLFVINMNSLKGFVSLSVFSVIYLFDYWLLRIVLFFVKQQMREFIPKCRTQHTCSVAKNYTSIQQCTYTFISVCVSILQFLFLV